jgi:hypothetical protein
VHRSTAAARVARPAFAGAAAALFPLQHPSIGRQRASLCESRVSWVFIRVNSHCARSSRPGQAHGSAPLLQSQPYRSPVLRRHVNGWTLPAIDRVLRSLLFGGGAINQTNVFLFIETMPYGGVGTSGMGKYGYDSLTHAKSVLNISAHRSYRSLVPIDTKEKVSALDQWFDYWARSSGFDSQDFLEAHRRVLRPLHRDQALKQARKLGQRIEKNRVKIRV